MVDVLCARIAAFPAGLSGRRGAIAVDRPRQSLQKNINIPKEFFDLRFHPALDGVAGPHPLPTNMPTRPGVRKSRDCERVMAAANGTSGISRRIQASKA